MIGGKTITTKDKPMQHYAPKPEEKVPLTRAETPEHQALMRAVDIYLKCPMGPDTPCPDDCKLLRRRIGEWAICAHLQQAGEIMLKREKEAQEAGYYNTRTGGYVKGL